MSVPEWVCSNCGSDRIGTVQHGIDNWPVAQCFDCGPKVGVIPDEPGQKRDKAINRAMNERHSKKAIHTVLRPLVERAQYRPKAKPEVAVSVGMFD